MNTNTSSQVIRQVIRLNRRLGRVTINGEEFGRWTGANRWMAEDCVHDLLSKSKDTYGRPVDRTCPDIRFRYR